MSWALYREERISALALRAYFAAHEMAARRCLLEPRRSPHFTREELAELLGGVGPAKVRAALHELAAVRLLTLTDRALEFAKKPADLAGELPACLGPMLAAFKSPARAVPVEGRARPRRNDARPCAPLHALPPRPRLCDRRPLPPALGRGRLRREPRRRKGRTGPA
jgi:hypothetical protein